MPSGKRIAGIYPHRKVPARGRLIGQDFLLCLQKKKKKNDDDDDDDDDDEDDDDDDDDDD